MPGVVRYYGNEYSPSAFSNAGWKGWLIRRLASFVARIERYIEKLVMRVVAAKQGLSNEDLFNLESQFDKESLQQDLKPVLDQLLGRTGDLERDERYTARKNTPDVGTYRQERGKRSEFRVALYGLGPRAVRYAAKRGRKYADPNGDCQE